MKPGASGDEHRPWGAPPAPLQAERTPLGAARTPHAVRGPTVGGSRYLTDAMHSGREGRRRDGAPRIRPRVTKLRYRKLSGPAQLSYRKLREGARRNLGRCGPPDTDQPADE